MKLLSILFAGLLISSCNLGQVDVNATNDLQQIENVISRQEGAWSKGDLDAFMQGYWSSDSLRFISARGETYGYKQVLANYKKGYPNQERMGALSFDLKNIKFLDSHKKIAQVTGVYYLTRNKVDQNQKDSGYFSLIFKKFDNEDWKIIIDHTF